MGVLSKPTILKYLEEGIIVIDPFNEENLNNASYDVRLGKYFFRQRNLDNVSIFNPFYEKSVRNMYQEVEEAVPVKEVRSEKNPFYNLADDDLVILIAPGETILAHTLEFIGGRNIPEKNIAITTEMRARSSIGRIGITVCKCAGWGDVGYINRWTMEITNFSNSIIPLPVGMRIAQIIFLQVSEIIDTESVYAGRKYQGSDDLEELKKNWSPEMMIPRLYEDKDIGNFQKYKDDI